MNKTSLFLIIFLCIVPVACTRLLYPYFFSKTIYQIYYDGKQIIVSTNFETDEYYDRINSMDQKRKMVGRRTSLMYSPLKKEALDNLLPEKTISELKTECSFEDMKSFMGRNYSFKLRDIICIDMLDDQGNYILFRASENIQYWKNNPSKLGNPSVFEKFHSDISPILMNDNSYVLSLKEDSFIVRDLSKKNSELEYRADKKILEAIRYKKSPLLIRIAAIINEELIFTTQIDTPAGRSVYRLSRNTGHCEFIARSKEDDEICHIFSENNNKLRFLVKRRIRVTETHHDFYIGMVDSSGIDLGKMIMIPDDPIPDLININVFPGDDGLDYIAIVGENSRISIDSDAPIMIGRIKDNDLSIFRLKLSGKVIDHILNTDHDIYNNENLVISK